MLVDLLIRWARRRPGSNRGCLERWWLVHYANPLGWALRLHRLFASEGEEFHDHPWPFVSLILRGGYWEVTPDGRRTWYGAGRLLFRKAGWFHRLELKPDQEAWTLCATGRMRQAWGRLAPDGSKVACADYQKTS